MTTGREVDEILTEIGREHRAIGAPESLERVLFAATSDIRIAAEKPRARLRWTLAAMAILLAAVATAGIIWQSRQAHPPQTQQAHSAPAQDLAPQPVVPSTRVTGQQNTRSVSAPARSAGRGHAGARVSAPKQATWNSLDEFVPLPASEGLPVAAELSVVRMRLRGSDLQQYGLQAPADAFAQTMLAEFVVGEDGLPRAIRIVR